MTGQKVWKTTSMNPSSWDGSTEVIASPAMTGATSPGGRVLFFSDLSGKFRAVDTSGNQLFSYSTGGFIYGSPVIANGHVYTTSSDGFLYAFAPGGAIGPKPDTTIASPADGANVPNTGTSPSPARPPTTPACPR